MLVVLVDYPNPPLNVRILDGPSSQFVMLSWDIPVDGTLPPNGPLSRPVDRYIVQALDKGRDRVYQDFATVSRPTVTTATITGLHPGTQYNIRVLAQNIAGATPSQVVNITTNSSGKTQTKDPKNTKDHFSIYQK